MSSSVVPFQTDLHPQVWYPQGTVLGPLLLPNCLFHSEPRMYVDDTHLTYSNGNIHSIQSLLNEDLLILI